MTCDVCNKRWNSAHKVSHSNIKTKKRQNPNIQRVRAIVAGAVRRLTVCTRCLRAGKVTKAA